jgi:hypothetical protein
VRGIPGLKVARDRETRSLVAMGGLNKPPPTAARGSSFAVTETVVNQSPSVVPRVITGDTSCMRFFRSRSGQQLGTVEGVEKVDNGEGLSH